ncbi:MAG: stage II sporulation protein M [Oscillospiraceae bacterium]
MERRDNERKLLPALLVLTGAFLVGLIAGALMADVVSGNGGDALSVYLESFLAIAQNGNADTPALVPLLWELFRWPVAVVLLSLTLAGLVCLPLLFALRGFLLAFAIGSFVRMFGGTGCLLAVPVFGISGLLTIPVIFVLGVLGWSKLRMRVSRPPTERKRSVLFGRVELIQCSICTGVLCVCVLLERFVVPPVLLSIAQLFTASH